MRLRVARWRPAARQCCPSNTLQVALLDLTDELGPDDTLLIYFSGHGAKMTIEADRQDVYLVTADFREQHVARDETRHISVRWLQDKVLQHTTVGKILLMLDCCYAGAIGEAEPDRYWEELQQRLKYYLNVQTANSDIHSGAARITLAAVSSADQAAEDNHSGLFTQALLQDLGGAASDEQGQITIQSLEGYLKRALAGKQIHGRYGFDHVDSFVLASSSTWQYTRGSISPIERRQRLQTMLPDHSGFLRDRLDSFVGREAELHEIRQRIAEKLPSGGYVTITGQAGQGKSSVIAKLVDEYGADAVAYHFIPFNPGPDHQVSLLRNLMARLILKYGLADVYVASESRPALRDFLPRVLREVAAQGHSEVIFVDGLDQIEPELNGERDLSFLPTNPPEGIVFVLGTRPNDTLKPLELLKPQHEYPLPNLSRADFDLILDRRGVALDPALATRFYAAMEANALYLDLVAQELAAAEHSDPEAIIQQIAANPNNIFSLTLDRLKRQSLQQWQQVLRPMFWACY